MAWFPFGLPMFTCKFGGAEEDLRGSGSISLDRNARCEHFIHSSFRIGSKCCRVAAKWPDDLSVPLCFSVVLSAEMKI